MNDTYKDASFIHQLNLLNARRLYLQLIFISKITNIAGNTIIYGTIIDIKTALPTSKHKWTNQKQTQQSEMRGLEDHT